MGRFVGYTVGGKAYLILEDGTNFVCERRNVLMEEKPAKAGTLDDGSSAGPQLKMTNNRDNSEGVDGTWDVRDAEGDFGEKHDLVEDSESEDNGDPDGVADENDDEERPGHNDWMYPVGTSDSVV